MNITAEQVATLAEMVRPFIEGELNADSMLDAAARAQQSEERFTYKMAARSEALTEAMAGTYDEFRKRAGIN